jgi:hypothetical protein
MSGTYKILPSDEVKPIDLCCRIVFVLILFVATPCMYDRVIMFMNFYQYQFLVLLDNSQLFGVSINLY